MRFDDAEIVYGKRKRWIVKRPKEWKTEKQCKEKLDDQIVTLRDVQYKVIKVTPAKRMINNDPKNIGIGKHILIEVRDLEDAQTEMDAPQCAAAV